MMDSRGDSKQSVRSCPLRACGWIGLILLLAFALRAVLIPYGLPLLLYEDEPIYYDHALRFGLGEWQLEYFKKPTFFLYFYGLFYAFTFLYTPFLDWAPFVNAFWEDPSLVASVGRLVSVLFAVGAVYLLYKIGRRVFNPAIGLAAAFLLAINTTHLRVSAIVISDIPSLFFILLSGWLALNVAERGRWKDYLLCAAAIALTVSFKYNFFTGAFLLAAHLVHRAEGNGLKTYPWKSALLDRYFWGAVLLIPVIFFALNPMTLMNFGTFFAHLNHERLHMLQRSTEADAGGWQVMASAGKIFGKIIPRAISWPVYVLALLGIPWIAKRYRPVSWVLLSFPLVFLLVVSQFKLVNAKYLLPTYPFLFLAASAVLHALVHQVQNRISMPPQATGRLFGFLVVMAAGLTLWETAEYVNVHTEKDSRNFAWQAIHELAQPGDRFFSEPDTVPLDPHYYRTSVTMGDWTGSDFHLIVQDDAQMHDVDITRIRPRYILMELKGHTDQDASGRQIYRMQYDPAYYEYVQRNYRWLKLFPTHPLALDEAGMKAILEEKDFAALTKAIKDNEAGKRKHPGPLLLMLARKTTD